MTVIVSSVIYWIYDLLENKVGFIMLRCVVSLHDSFYVVDVCVTYRIRLSRLSQSPQSEKNWGEELKKIFSLAGWLIQVWSYLGKRDIQILPLQKNVDKRAKLVKLEYHFALMLWSKYGYNFVFVIDFCVENSLQTDE